MVYLIRSTTEYGWGGKRDPLYWSNEDGWVDKANATKFKAWEIWHLRLPIGGVWVRG